MAENPWDQEYLRKGIPSSFKEGPSGSLRWALSNWHYLTGEPRPGTALDVGCGTGRNTIHLAKQDVNTLGFDSSHVAVSLAEQRLLEGPTKIPATFLEHNLSQGLPSESSSLDLVIDLFVYKHQADEITRTNYRQEIRRVLKPRGKFLLSLAGLHDGYYTSCPTLPYWETRNGMMGVLDPITHIPSVLFHLSILIDELSDTFELEMAWQKEKYGQMHNEEYLRHTIATIWSPKL